MPFQEGNTLGGRKSTGLQSVSDRLSHWLTTKTVDEIEALVKNKAEWKKLTAIDGVLVRRIDAAFKKVGSNVDFTAVLDRFVGKAVQPIAAEFKVTHGLADRIEKARKLADNTTIIEQVMPMIIENDEQVKT